MADLGAQWWSRLGAGLSETPMRLEVPRWVHLFIVANASLTATVAMYVLGGPLGAILLAIPLAGGIVAWIPTTYRNPAPRRLLPLYLAAGVSLHLVYTEQWLADIAPSFRSASQSLWPGSTPLTEPVWMTAFPIVLTVLFLLGGAGLFFHHPLGSLMGWVLFLHAIVYGLSPFLLALATTLERTYVPGMFAGAVPVWLGVTGLRLTINLTRSTPDVPAQGRSVLA